MSSWHALWRTKKKKKKAQEREGWDRTPCSHCQGPGFDSVVGELSAHKSHSMVKHTYTHTNGGIKSK